MKLVRLAGLVLVLFAAAVSAACGSKSHETGHAGEKATPAPPPPTPDTTPIEALRTPAGLVLKIESAPTPAVPK
ncbi:MAG: hypothetical protein WEB59_16625 [Thermoanaerobaculia bacterium]